MLRRTFSSSIRRRSHLVLAVWAVALPAVLFSQDRQANAADTEKMETVDLTDHDLAAGVPGDGPLSMDDIKKWLADPKQHRTLEPKLPLGLAAGQNEIFIPADNPLTRAKIELGRQLYFDRRLSKGEEVSCADCHHPDDGYGRRTQFGVGILGQEGNRNSPTSLNRIMSKAQFWDGRAASLEEQAVGPIANPIEMGSTHEVVVKMLNDNDVYRTQFESVFGRAPTIDDVGKAIAAFERIIVTGPSSYDLGEPLRRMNEAFAEELADLELLKEDDPDLYDDYMKLVEQAASKPMSPSAQRGRALFFSQRANCSACHAGANFTDELYHNLGVGMQAADPDLGRFAVTNDEKDKGAFKTPTLRNVAQNPPYMHDGSQKTLLEVVQWYVKGGHPTPYLSDKIKKFDANEQEMADLVAFMEALTGDLPNIESGRLPK